MLMQIGRRIYFDAITGNVLVDTGERQGFVTPTTPEQDIATYTALTERNPDSFAYIDLEYGQYMQDFAACNGYRINPETQQIEFSYPDPNEPEPQEPVYMEPLSEQVEAQSDAIAELSTMIALLMAP